MMRNMLRSRGNDKQDRLALAARTARASDTMNIRLAVVRHIVINNMRNSLNIQPARSDVSRHHDVDLARLGGRSRCAPAVAAEYPR